MQISKTFTDKRSGNAAIAAETVTRRGVLVSDSLTAWNSGELPDSSTLGDPALLAVGGGNPDSGLIATVVYEQGPLGFEIVDVFVGDLGASDRVYDNQVVLVEHKLGANPHEVGGHCNGCANRKLNGVNGALGGVEDYLSQEQGIKNEGHDGPGEVALGSENIFAIHASIIAGSPAVQEGK